MLNPAQEEVAPLQLVVVGDIHAQASKFWQIMREAGVADAAGQPSANVLRENLQVILLGDLVHAKSRTRYSELTGIASYDEYNPEHLRAAEAAQESFLREVRDFQQLLPEGRLTILMGNHDFNAITESQGPLRTDDVTHLEWKESTAALPADLKQWISSWPFETVVQGLHFAHVGPLPEHNTFDQSFYLENRRRWLQQDRDLLAETPYQLGVYGHTPMRGGLSVASQGRALLIDNNGVRDEYSFMLIDLLPDSFRVRLQGLYFDELYSR